MSAGNPGGSSRDRGDGKVSEARRGEDEAYASRAGELGSRRVEASGDGVARRAYTPRRAYPTQTRRVLDRRGSHRRAADSRRAEIRIRARARARYDATTRRRRRAYLTAKVRCGCSYACARASEREVFPIADRTPARPNPEF